MPDHIFFPRVSYQNIILLPARWNLSHKNLKIQKGTAPIEIEKIQRNIFQDFDIPKAYLTQSDNKILIDWKNPDHFALILQDFIANENIVLLESMRREDEQSILSEKGSHIGEIVVPFVKKQIYKIETEASQFPSTSQISLNDRFRFPGSEWLYAKLFVARDQEEDFLKINFSPFILYLSENQLIDKLFYIRYMDEKPHIRLRLHSSQEKTCKGIIPLLHQYASQRATDGIIHDFSFHSYEREIERYGGPLCIDTAEEIFQTDSQSCLNLLEKISSFDLPPHIFGAFGLINILQGFFPIEEQLSFLSSLKLDQNHLSNLREHTPKAVLARSPQSPSQ